MGTDGELVCRHGHLARVCLVCELEERLAAMTRERDGWVSMLKAEQKQRNENLLEMKELRAEVERLKALLLTGDEMRNFLYEFQTYRWEKAKEIVDRWDRLRAALGEL